MNVVLCVYPDFTLITEYEEIYPTNIGDPDLLLTNPYTIQRNNKSLLIEEAQTNTDFLLTPWLGLSFYTDQTKFETHSDKILTMAKPKDILLKQYLKLVQSRGQEENE
jgi:hypothetical protein